MKFIYKFLLTVVSIPVVLLLIANSSGSPGGRTGSPGDGNQNCTSCHSGTAQSQTGWISTNIPNDGYSPGQTYQITLNASHAGSSKFGFELTAEATGGQKAGMFVITQANRTKLVNQNRAVTHTNQGTAATGGSTNWVMNWTAPNTAQGPITFYAAVNASNSNSGTSGDVIYLTNLTIQPMAPAALTAVQPNSAAQGQNINLTITGTNTNWTGTSPVVQLVFTSNPNQIINAQTVNVISNTQLLADFTIPLNAAPGVYHLKVNDLQLNNAFTVTTITNIAEKIHPSFKVFPNPTTGEKVVVEHSMHQPIIRIIDQHGRTVFESTLTQSPQSLQLTQLPKGTYTMMLANDQQHQMQKFIIR